MKYRILAPDEVERLAFIFEPRGLPVPDPRIERVAIVEDDDKIVAMVLLRLLPMIDGLWAAPEYRGGKIDYTRLVELAEEPIKQLRGRTYALAPSNVIANAAKNAGYHQVAWPLYEKEH